MKLKDFVVQATALSNTLVLKSPDASRMHRLTRAEQGTRDEFRNAGRMSTRNTESVPEIDLEPLLSNTELPRSSLI
jgi:hypothetical protein